MVQSVVGNRIDKALILIDTTFFWGRQKKSNVKKVNKVTSDGDKGCEENKIRVMWLRLSGSLW